MLSELRRPLQWLLCWLRGPRWERVGRSRLNFEPAWECHCWRKCCLTNMDVTEGECLRV
jgi:hypothetical protein